MKAGSSGRSTLPATLADHGQALLLEQHRPRGGRTIESLAIVDQQVAPPLVGRAVVALCRDLPRRRLEARVDVRVARQLREIDRLYAAVRDQRGRDVARGDDEVEIAAVDEREHLDRGLCGRDVHAAARALLERRHPVDRRVRAATLDCTGRSENVQFVLERLDRIAGLRRDHRRAVFRHAIAAAAAERGEHRQESPAHHPRRFAPNGSILRSTSSPSRKWW